ncbi:NAD(P)H-dependent oxidoreductase [Pseudenhygromyxa sp. WMMC2535]|nr:NAD(P)H-dependent oxidoreductase [Pseudenhygromyxa sp. WMMC2535]
MTPKILVVCGSSRVDGKLEQLTALAANSARQAGAEVRELSLERTPCPSWSGVTRTRPKTPPSSRSASLRPGRTASSSARPSITAA